MTYNYIYISSMAVATQFHPILSGRTSSNKSELANKWRCTLMMQSKWCLLLVLAFFSKMCKPGCMDARKTIWYCFMLQQNWSEQIFVFSLIFPVFFFFFLENRRGKKNRKTCFKMCIFYYHWALLLYHRPTVKMNAVVSPVDI